MNVIILAALAGVGTGMLSGLVGIGGGVVLVPLLLYLFRADMHVAVGTSLAVIIPTAIAGVISHYTVGNVSWKLGLSIAPGAIAGAVLGAYLANLLPAETLKRVFAVIMVIMSFKILFDSFGISLWGRSQGAGAPATEIVESNEKTGE